MIQKTFYKTKDYCKVKFVYNAPDTKSVEILGLNNNWAKPVALKQKKDGSFSVDVQLQKKSSHQFKYRVNKNTWHNEPDADGEQYNEFGGTNSVINL